MKKLILDDKVRSQIVRLLPENIDDIDTANKKLDELYEEQLKEEQSQENCDDKSKNDERDIADDRAD